jgi:hypothetical protein
MNDARRMVLVCVVLLAGLPLVGCTGYTIRPPVEVAEPAHVYIVDYGWTSRLWLPEDAGGFTEWGYGDWRWYAKDQKNLLYGAVLLSWPTQATLGKHDQESGPWTDEGELQPGLVGYAGLVHEFDVEEAALAALRTSLHERFASQSDTEFYNEGRQMSFVKDDTGYWFWNQSTTVMAGWTRELGCEASGFSLRANYEIKEPGITTVIDPKK